MIRLSAFGLLIFVIFTAAGCPRPDGYTTSIAITNAEFERATGMVWIPGDAPYALVLAKRGIVWRVNTAQPSEQPTMYLDIRDRILPDTTTEEGLLGFVFAPDFPTSGRFFIHYTAPGDEFLAQNFRPRKSVIARFQGGAQAADPDSHVSVLEVQDPFPNHNGGAMVFGPDGYLYLSIGDGGSGGDPLGNAQRLDTLFGKILRIDVSGEGYTVPADNPFVGVPDARPEIWAYGFRNPWRMSFDRDTGVLWVGDVGQNLIEEVDIVVRGGNYGWNVLEGSQCYNAASCDGSQTMLPVAEYTHADGCAVTGGYVYRGEQMPELEGWYIYGDFCSGQVWGVTADEGVERTPVRLATTGLEISSFAEDPSGEIWVIGYQTGVYRLVRK